MRSEASGVTLADLAGTPARVTELTPAVAQRLLLSACALVTALAARASEGQNGNLPHIPDDQLLTVEEAARRLGASEDWCYRHAKQLPFTVRLGTRQLRFSLRGLERWVQARQGP